MIQIKVVEALGKNANQFQLDEVIDLMLIYSDSDNASNNSEPNKVVPGSDVEKLINSWNSYFQVVYN